MKKTILLIVLLLVAVWWTRAISCWAGYAYQVKTDKQLLSQVLQQSEVDSTVASKQIATQRTWSNESDFGVFKDSTPLSIPAATQTPQTSTFVGVVSCRPVYLPIYQLSTVIIAVIVAVYEMVRARQKGGRAS